MSHNSREGMSGGSIPTGTDSSGSSPEGRNLILKIPNPPSILPGALPDSTTVNPGIDRLPCPVPGCSSVFKGKTPDGYLWRHLGRPGVHGFTPDEKAVWENLYKIERDRLLATRVTPARRKREANKAKARKRLRTAEFELRARDMGITEELVAQKVAIWEGMWATEQNGKDVEVSILIPLHSRGSSEDVADRKGN